MTGWRMFAIVGLGLATCGFVGAIVVRDDADLDRVEADVLGVVDRTFHPERAGAWLR